VSENIIDEMTWRGLIAQSTDVDALKKATSEGPITLYSGFDPTGPSLHAGHLVPLLALKRFQRAGHRPIILAGGATGLIGDPRDVGERTMNSREVVTEWASRIRGQLERFVDMDESPTGAVVVNNLSWTGELSAIDFLRDIGKHFSINVMLARETVKNRLESDGMSYTEFSYMLLQAMDFLRLAQSEDCLLQIGGSDQWGNIVSGIDLIRRHTGKSAFALTTPLVTKADGTKFGKSASGAIWLDANKTSPYTFYQFWLNSADADVSKFLRLFTFLPKTDITHLETLMQEHPERREAHRKLAQEVTALVHGSDAVVAAERISEALFAGDTTQLCEGDLLQLQQDGLSSSQCAVGTGLLTALVDAALCKSTGEARKLIQANGIKVNGAQVDDMARDLPFDDALFQRYYLIRKGKKNYHLIVRGD